MVLRSLGLRTPRVHLHARLTIKGQPKQKREIVKLIKDGNVQGWDDPRLVTIAALRKRGVKAEAIREFALSPGMSMVGGIVDIGALFAENKKIIDPISKRLYYVENPVKISLSTPVNKEVELPLHPTNKGMGVRKAMVRDTVYVSMRDAAELRNGEEVRLKGLFTIKITGADLSINKINAEMSERDSATKTLQWVAEGAFISTFVEIPGRLIGNNGEPEENSMGLSRGYVEEYAKKLTDGETVQFERFGFCSYHTDDKEPYFIFISK